MPGATGGLPASEHEARLRTGQLSLFTEYLDHPVIEELRKLELDRLSPMEAFDRLRKLAERARDTQR